MPLVVLLLCSGRYSPGPSALYFPYLFQTQSLTYMYNLCEMSDYHKKICKSVEESLVNSYVKKVKIMSKISFLLDALTYIIVVSKYVQGCSQRKIIEWDTKLQRLDEYYSLTRKHYATRRNCVKKNCKKCHSGLTLCLRGHYVNTLTSRPQYSLL